MPNWAHNTLTVSGDEEDLVKFIEAAKSAENPDSEPLSFQALVPQPSDEELRKLESYQPCTMCGAKGTLPETQAQASDQGARWYPWMDSATRADRTCNVCSGSKKERVGMEGWYEWRLRHWGTKWDASFSESMPFVALGSDGVDVDLSKSTQGLTRTPTVAIYKFDTAWSPPTEFVQAASEKFPELEFTLQFGEVGHDYAGRIRVIGGVVISSEDLEVSDVLSPEELWF